VADRSAPVTDYLGAFAVTAGIGAEELARGFERAHDDYNAILTKALADRLAEAFAAFLHARARREWGLTDGASPDDIIAERHHGIRPGFGYPACPDHSQKFTLFELLDPASVGITLTDHAAMLPAASVSGLYFSHRRAKYFSVGRIGEDQVAAYARHKGCSVEEAERWLMPSLAYAPA
jgi:5-methyltetrahydrofolate--homocysteine methyltransferase